MVEVAGSNVRNGGCRHFGEVGILLRQDPVEGDFCVGRTRMIHGLQVSVVGIGQWGRTLSLDQPDVTGDSIDRTELPPEIDIFDAGRGAVEDGSIGPGVGDNIRCRKW